MALDKEDPLLESGIAFDRLLKGYKISHKSAKEYKEVERIKVNYEGRAWLRRMDEGYGWNMDNLVTSPKKAPASPTIEVVPSSPDAVTETMGLLMSLGPRKTER